MAYTNSPLASYTKLSPNHSGRRTHAIDRITPHCVVGQLTAEGICGCFTSRSSGASCNYAIGADGKIGLCVDEANRSWCSSSNANDQRAVTIECASDKAHPYAMTKAVYESLADLCEDICRRNGKKKLVWIPDKYEALTYEPKDREMLITVHRWFANKSCPGDWLYSRLGGLAKEVTARLKKKDNDTPPKGDSSLKVRVKVDDLNIRSAPSASAKVLGQTGKGTFTIVTEKDGWGKLKSGAGWIRIDNEKYTDIIK